MTHTTLDSAELESLIVTAIARHGRTPDDAVRLTARALVEAERIDAPEFGLRMLVAALGASTDWSPSSPSCSGLVVARNAEGRFAPLVLAETSLATAEAAEADGMSLTTVIAPTALGRLAPFVRTIAGRGLVGLAAAGSPPLVAPHGGTGPALGTNPIAVGLPASDGPIVLDAASSAITKGRWSRLRDEGADLPPGTAIDAAGAPAVDPSLVDAFLPRGGLAGTALALVVEALTNGIAGMPGSSPDRRAAVVLAVRPLDADSAAAAVGDDLRSRLTAAGGHVPGSRIPRASGPVTIDARVRDALLGAVA